MAGALSRAFSNLCAARLTLLNAISVLKRNHQWQARSRGQYRFMSGHDERIQCWIHGISGEHMRTCKGGNPCKNVLYKCFRPKGLPAGVKAILFKWVISSYPAQTEAVLLNSKDLPSNVFASSKLWGQATGSLVAIALLESCWKCDQILKRIRSILDICLCLLGCVLVLIRWPCL